MYILINKLINKRYKNMKPPKNQFNTMKNIQNIG